MNPLLAASLGLPVGLAALVVFNRVMAAEEKDVD